MSSRPQVVNDGVYANRCKKAVKKDNRGTWRHPVEIRQNRHKRDQKKESRRDEIAGGVVYLRALARNRRDLDFSFVGASGARRPTQVRADRPSVRFSLNMRHLNSFCPK